VVHLEVSQEDCDIASSADLQDADAEQVLASSVEAEADSNGG